MLIAASSTAPWWGVALIAGGFSLLGVIVTQFFTQRSRKLQSKSEQERRWDQQSYDVCSRFLSAARSVMPFAVSKTETGSLKTDTQDEFDLAPHLGTLEEAAADLELFAPAALKDSAKQVL